MTKDVVNKVKNQATRKRRYLEPKPCNQENIFIQSI